MISEYVGLFGLYYFLIWGELKYLVGVKMIPNKFRLKQKSCLLFFAKRKCILYDVGVFLLNG